MLLDIVIYPHPILKQIAEPVEHFDDDLRELIANMRETMRVGLGVGLAAPQVNKSIQLFIVDTSRPDETSNFKAYINPKIILKDEAVIWNEGCLSLPGLFREVETFEHVIVEAQDEWGKTFTEEARDLRAVAIAHEYEHLQGKVFIDRLNPVKRSLSRKFWNKNSKRLAQKMYKDTDLKCIFST